MKLKITLRNHLVALLFSIVVILGSIIILIYYQFDYIPVLVLSIFFLVYDIPGLYLHLEYWLRNKGEEYELRPDMLIRYKQNKEERYPVEEIDRILVLMSPSLYKNWYLHFFAIEQYHYAQVYLKNGEKLFITCLLAPRVDKALQQTLRNVKIERKQWLFNTTYTPESWYS